MRKIAKCLMCKLEKERNVYVLSTWQDGRSYTNTPFIYRISTVYQPYIYRSY